MFSCPGSRFLANSFPLLDCMEKSACLSEAFALTWKGESRALLTLHHISPVAWTVKLDNRQRD
jgi:hypothetical protein